MREPDWKETLTKRDIPLSFDDWVAFNEDKLAIEAAESGQDRELGFDMDVLLDRAYEQYRKKINRGELT